jgi:hypothetical protein
MGLVVGTIIPGSEWNEEIRKEPNTCLGTSPLNHPRCYVSYMKYDLSKTILRGMDTEKFADICVSPCSDIIPVVKHLSLHPRKVASLAVQARGRITRVKRRYESVSKSFRTEPITK